MFRKSLVASATCAAIGITAAGSAQAINFGEFWAADQIGGVLHIFKQSELNDATVDAQETKITLTGNVGSADGGTHSSVRMHILGFSNHAGLDPASRTIMTYLDGWGEIWATNGGTQAPTKIADLEASTVNAYTEEGLGAPVKGNSLHACGGNPQNDQIQCASIFNGDLSLFDADMSTDTYTRIGIYKTGDLTLHPNLSSTLGVNRTAKVQAAYDDMVATDADGNPNNICSQYSTDGQLLYIAAQTSTNTGGVIVLDVSDPTNPTILDAYNSVMAAGCGLVNHPDGKSLWITHGFNKQGDPEEISIWRYRRAGKKHGPAKRVALPTDASQPLYGGDAHGMQFAGLLNSYVWQVMRVDDTVHVVYAPRRSKSAALVNTMDLHRPGRQNIQPDVIDRSSFGTRMYHTTRGARPTSAIGSTATGAGAVDRYNFISRSGHQGVDVLGTIFGYSGSFLKEEVMTNGGTIYLCPPSGASTTGYVENCNAGDAGAVAVDSSDPHGGKSLNYLTGF